MKLSACLLFMFFSQIISFSQTKENNLPKNFEGEIEVQYFNAPFSKIIYLIKDSAILRHEFPIKNYRHGYTYQFLDYKNHIQFYCNEQKKELVSWAIRNNIVKNDFIEKDHFVNLHIDTVIANTVCHIYEFYFNALITPSQNINKVQRVYVADTLNFKSTILSTTSNNFYNPYFNGIILKTVTYDGDYNLAKAPLDFEVTKITYRKISKEEITPNSSYPIYKMNRELGELILTDDD
ncbi:MAG: hypothetical protein JST94_11590 [Bacteroidetes bacterium]|nr:hypothetical protein [Bacteroidota bacterium]MBS1641013.1 hypothetical protein [Bacteroidota bacterium]MBS1672069.1 hypothetical protein [Bacteroidota bacterium]